MILSIPLVFFNKGALPVLVQDLRLALPKTGTSTPFVFTRTADELSISAKRKLAVQFPVRPREALSIICEFDRTPAELDFEARIYQVDLEAVFGSRMKWRRISSFQLTIVLDIRAAANEPGFLALDNSISYW